MQFTSWLQQLIENAVALVPSLYCGFYLSHKTKVIIILIDYNYVYCLFIIKFYFILLWFPLRNINIDQEQGLLGLYKKIICKVKVMSPLYTVLDYMAECKVLCNLFLLSYCKPCYVNRWFEACIRNKSHFLTFKQMVGQV